MTSAAWVPSVLSRRDWLRVWHRVAIALGCVMSELRGETLRSVFSWMSPEYVILWGMYIEADLDRVLGGAA